VRRDRADVFSTLAEGLKGKRAKEWGLIDDTFPTTKFQDGVDERVAQIVNLRNSGEKEAGNDAGDPQAEMPALQGIKLHELTVGAGLVPARVDPEGRAGTSRAPVDTRDYKYVSLRFHRDKRCADLTMRAPESDLPTTAEEIQELGSDYWPLRVYRELDDALLHLRVNEPEIGLVCVRSEGSIESVLAVDKTLAANRDHWLVRETLLQMARTLRRMDLTAKSFFSIIEPGSCFAGNVFELVLASDRSYMLNNPEKTVEVALSELNVGAFPMSNGLTRLQSRFLAEPKKAYEAFAHEGRFDTEAADAAGLVTFAPDDLDWDDEIRLAIEERTSLSPDALTGMEASLRFAGPETMDTKIYGRLTAWQNWIFQRPNAVGPNGALTNYGKPTQAKFDYKRT
jgi:benzoyl-CoA-dihydrodiol lyase